MHESIWGKFATYRNGHGEGPWARWIGIWVSLRILNTCSLQEENCRFWVAESFLCDEVMETSTPRLIVHDVCRLSFSDAYKVT